MFNKCSKCGKDMSKEDYCYNFPDGIQCEECGKGRKTLRDPTEEEMKSTEKCKECGMDMVLYEWKCRQGICVVCTLKKELEH